MSEVKGGCCGGSVVQNGASAPVTASKERVKPTSSVVVGKSSKQQCCTSPSTSTTQKSLIKDQCHACPEAPKGLYAISLALGSQMPACGVDGELSFEEDLTGFPTGVAIFNASVGTLIVTGTSGSNVLIVKNPCTSCQIKQPGQAIATTSLARS